MGYFQSPAQLYNSDNNRTYNPFERILHRPGQNLHGSLKPLRIDELSEKYNTDSLIQRGLPTTSNNAGILKRFFSTDLFSWDKNNVEIRINPIFNFEMGNDSQTGETWFVNTRGAMVEGKLGENLGFYVDLRENQATLPGYIDEFARQRDIVPGQGRRKDFGENGHDYAQSTGYVSYNAGKWINLQAGFGKNFIGDGYRSLFLSDVAYSYPFFKMTASFLNAKYMLLVSELKHFERDRTLGDTRYPSKYGAFHYLNWNIGDRFSLGLFESVIWAAKDTVGHRGIDVNYVTPLVVFRPVEYNLGSPDNMTMGLNFKYILWKDAAIYGQFVLGEFKFDEVFSGEKWWANKQGFLAGLEIFNLLGIQNFDFQTEYSQVRPYTYSHYQPITNYGHFNQELAHPLGANFRESISFLRYRTGRWHFEFKAQLATKGLDMSEDISYGGSIHKPNITRPADYGHAIGQGLKSKLTQAQLNVSWLINPKNNMNLMMGARYRKISNDQESVSGNYIYAAFRTSLQNIYYEYF
ncbi:hypothetical protein DDZ16_06635 [Marinilabilia rubra]|uniref:Gliding motility protein RemB n=1 Tax=Marinilabilia rubra TaxID=2162893 RepID=A0A2U2BAZ0_9BACT|nr:hypothetical protein DDZ16_06635 [Marinilabilia rubra]